MKLGELLVRRKSSKSQLASLTERLKNNAKVQEGETAQEEPRELIPEIINCLVEIEDYTTRINRTNEKTFLGQGIAGETLATALIHRERLIREKNIYSSLLEAMTVKEARYGRMEIKFRPAISPKEVKERLDAATKSYRDLDGEIQHINWTTEEK